MNRNLYRIVFNVKRGQLMAVAETASAQGKTAGETQGGGRSGGSLSALHPVCFAVLAALGMVSPLAQAQIVADPSAPGSQRATILATASGAPLINITTPSAAGVSTNTYSQFDVQRNGVIFNNSRSNPWLIAPARKILNLVNSSNPSLLNGPIQVAGSRAEVIIANPSGIQVNGGSFLNASGVTLTTGTPVYSGSGDIDSYRVQGGTVNITGLGLDASTAGFTNILARAVTINASLFADQLQIITGANSVSAADPGSATPIAGTGARPAFALDAGLLSGMYANSIKFKSTEDGLEIVTRGATGVTGNALFQVNGGVNNQGVIQAQGDAQINATGPVSNSGTVFANGNASVASQDSVSNTGTVYAQGNTTVTAQTSVRNSGTIQALGNTSVTAQNGISNSGTVYAQGTTAVTTPGNVSNTGVMAAQGNTTVQATGAGASITSTAGSVMAAGLNPDGTLATAGNLSVSAAGAANLNGQSVAGGNAGISGAQVSLADGQLQGRNITVTASTGHVDASRASITTQGTLAANAAQTLRTDGAAVSARQLALAAHDLSNVGGEIIQMGTGNTTVAMAGTIDNTSGRIGTNGQNLTLAANTLTNTDGKLEHAGSGTLALAANTFNDQRGQTTSSGALALTAGSVNHDSASTIAAQVSVNAGTLNNHAGEIIQTGTGATSITTTGALDNSAGTIASNGNTSVSAQSLNNQGGRVLSANASSLTVTTTGLLDNSANGQLAAGGSATVGAGALDNSQGRITAGADLTATVTGALTNIEGLIAANGANTLSAASLDNTRGTVASVQNNLTVITTGLTTNDNGRLEALGDVMLSNHGLSNSTQVPDPDPDPASDSDSDSYPAPASGGSITGRNISIDTHGQALNNEQGTLASTQDMMLQTGALNNTQGLIQSGGALGINTHGEKLTNHNIRVQYGYDFDFTSSITSQGAMTLETGDLFNYFGFIGAKDALTAASTGEINNIYGQIVSEASIGLTTTTGLINYAGEIQALGDISVAAGTGTIHNEHALILSAGTTTLSGDYVYNVATLTYPDEGIGGRNVAITANSIDNFVGAIRADANATLTVSETFDNSSGLLSAGKAATVQDGAAGPSARTLAIINHDGTMAAGLSLTVNAASLDNNSYYHNNYYFGENGRLLSRQDLSLSLKDDFNNPGTVSAARNNTVSTLGTLTNSGKLQAGATLDVTASTINNTATGEMTGSTVKITATGANTLINRGLIDGVDTQINTITLDNVGTGRIYGDKLSIAATTVNNIAETVNGITKAATIAARQRLDIGVTTLNNNNGALIFSGGTGADALNIGGALDAGRRAIGRAGTLNNSGGTIESLGAANISAGQINNTNPNFAYALQGGNVSSGPAREFVTGWGTFSSADGAWALGSSETPLALPHGGFFYGMPVGGGFVIGGGNADPRGKVVPPGSTYSSAAYRDLYRTPDAAPYGLYVAPPADTGVWARFGLAVPTISPPVDAKPVAYCPGTLCDGDRADAQWVYPNSTDVAQWEASAAPWLELQARMDAFRFAVNVAALPFDGFRDYSSATQTAVITQSTPGRMLSAGAMALDASTSLVNDQSQIIAGGALNITGQAVENRGRTINANAQRTGTAYFWSNYNEGCGSWDGCDYNYNAYRAAPYVQDVPQSLPLTLNIARSQSLLSPSGQGLASGAQLGSANTGHTDAAITAPGAASAVVHSVGIVQVTSAVAGVGAVAGSTPVVRTIAPNFTLPTASLFHARANPIPTAHYIIETDPRFANYRNWLSSDYLLQALSLDPATTQKRLGDGFYEQRLVNEQIAQLTGQRFLAGYSSEETQYKALMDAGTTFAQQYQLRPGIALSAQQMAQLTSDIVWLVEQTVTLADGSTTTALVPQVYARVREGDLDGTGTLLAGQVTNLNLSGDLTNTGTLAGRTVMALTAENVNNLGGRISGNDVTVAANNDLNNIGGTIDGANSLTAIAGRDLNVVSTTSSANNQTSDTSSNNFSLTGIDRVAGLYVTGANGGTLVASAGRDVNLIAGIIANNGATSDTTVIAQRDLNLGTVGIGSSSSLVRGAGTDFLDDRQAADVGSQVNAQGNLTLGAGRDLNAKAASVQAAGDLTAVAGNNITITAGQQTNSSSFGLTTSESDLFSSSSTTERRSGEQSNAVGSSIGGNTITAIAGNNLGITGSSVISDAGTALGAGNNLTIQAATNTSSSSDFKETKESGLMGSGGFGITIGSQEQSLDQKTQGTTAAASTVGSIAGDVNLQAGNAYKQVGSDVTAPQGDIDIKAKKVDIVEARETSQTTIEQKFKQDGLTFEVTSPVLSALQTAQQMSEAASNTSDARMKGLAAANTAFAANKAADAIQKGQGTTINGKEGQIATGKDVDGNVTSRDATAADKAGGIDLAISLGGSESQSRQESQSDTARGSTVSAAGNVNITATGAGQDSNLTIQGSTVDAGRAVQLLADNEIKLLAAKNTATQNSTNSSSSSSVGISYGTNGLMFNASGSKGSGKSDGSDTSYVNTEIKGGTQVDITSGGNTTLQGALVKADQIKATVGGDLKIESMQDASSYISEQKNASASVSIGYGNMSGSVSASNSSINSDFKSVGEQSGIKAGDGGFQVSVQGNTDLIGGVIASTEKAVQDGKNSFQTGGALTATDLQNSASYEGKASGFSLGGGPVADMKGITGLGIGLGSDKKDASSTTSAGISGIAGNTAVRSTDAETGLKPIFDADKVQREINAQVQITQAFTRDATKAVGDYADKKLNEALALRTQASTEENSDRAAALKAQAQDIEDSWGDKGVLRLAAHTLIGGLTGGISGAAGAAAGTLTAPTVAQTLMDAGIDGPLAKTLTALASTAAGAALGGTAGASAALSEVTNNFLSHEEASRRLKLMEQKLACKDQACATSLQSEIDKLNQLDNWRDQQIAQACRKPDSAACGAWVSAIQVAAASYKGKYDDNPLITAERSSVLNDAYRYAQANNNPLMNGVGKGLLKLSPTGILGGIAVGSYALTISIVDNGLTDTAINLIKGIANIPADLMARLNSDDPAVRGEALVDTLAAGTGVAAVGTKLTQAGYGAVVRQAEAKAVASAEAAAIAKMKVENNIYASDSLTDPAKAISSGFGGKTALELSPTEARQLVYDRVPASAQVQRSESADALNAQVLAKDASFKPPYVPQTEAVTFKTVEPERFVRVYTDTPTQSAQVGTWMFKEADIRGLSAEKIASKYSLPQLPTMMTDVNVPAGQTLRATVANDVQIRTGIAGNGGGGGVQFEVLDAPKDPDIFKVWFTNPRILK